MPTATPDTTTPADTLPPGVGRIRAVDDLVEVRDYITTVTAALSGISRNFDVNAADAVLRVSYAAGDKLQAVIDRLCGRDVDDDEEDQP